MKNKQLVIEWDWKNLDGFEHSICIKWLFFYIEIFHPVENIFDRM